MAEYIDRQAAINVVKKWFDFIELNGDICIDGLISLPDADVVEVVRCKDCINHRQNGLCEGWSRYGTISTHDDAFCSYGVKRDV